MKILFIDGTKGFSPTRLATKPTGGIATSLTIVPQALFGLNHDVTVMSLHETTETVNGVKYLPIQTDITTLPAQDVVVFNRNCIERPVAQFFKDKGARIFWWLHDIVDPRYLADDGYKLADKIIALSQYCLDAYSDFYGIDTAKFVIIGNGVDKSVFSPNPTVERRGNLFVTASAPIKGLYPLPFAWHNIKRNVPDAELRVYSSQSLHDLPNTAEHDRQVEELRKAGARIMDPVPQSELAQAFREATAVLMPNSYPEICSNILLQAQACGAPVVASNIGSASEYIKHRKTGMLTHTAPHDLFWWHKDFTAQCLTVAGDASLRQYISMQSASAVRGWHDVTLDWRRELAPALVEAA